MIRAIISKDRNVYEDKVSRVVSSPLAPNNDDGLDGEEKTEIAAQITMPADGGWGWVILACSFSSICILDGICSTFGAQIDDLSKDLKKPMSLVSLIGSLQSGTYYLGSPFGAALINRFGFRACIMSSSFVISLSLLVSYFSEKFELICFFYGVCTGFGGCVLNMSAGLSVGFYFEKYRTIALAIAGTGSSFGVMSFFPINTYLTKISGWRSTCLFQSGLMGIVYFLGLAYRPLLSFTVTLEEDNVTEPTRTVTVLPSLAKPSTIAQGVVQSTAVERAMRAVSNAHFPTAAAVVSTPIISGAPGISSTSGHAVSRLTLRANTPNGAVSRQQLQKVQSIISKYNVQDQKTPTDQRRCSVDLTNIKINPPNKRCFVERLFSWEPEVEQARPMYRDDAFYEGPLKDLPEYQKSVLKIDPKSKTGLEYQLAVTRAVTVNDLHDKRGVFTTAVRRVLASMLDFSLLKQWSFILLCFNGFLCHLGYLIPLVYLRVKNEKAGMDPTLCSLMLSMYGFMNAFGRILAGMLSTKVNPIIMYTGCVMVNGASTLCCPFMHGVYLQYLYAMMFGGSAGGLSGLRSIVVVKIYGLAKLTNAMGVILLFIGIGNLLCVPIGGVLEGKYGYDVSFYYSGSCVFLSGFMLIPVLKMFLKESNKAESAKTGGVVKEIRPKQSSPTKAPQPSPAPLSPPPPSPPPPPPPSPSEEDEQRLPRSPSSPPSPPQPSLSPPPPPPPTPSTTTPTQSTTPSTSRQHHQQQERSHYRP